MADEPNIILENQKTVILDGFKDYKMLLTDWRAWYKKNKDFLDVDQLSKVVMARMKVDDMGRKAVGLLGTKPREEKEKEGNKEHKPKNLSWGGNGIEEDENEDEET